MFIERLLKKEYIVLLTDTCNLFFPVKNYFESSFKIDPLYYRMFIKANSFPIHKFI